MNDTGKQCRHCKNGDASDQVPGMVWCLFNNKAVVEADVPHCAAQELTDEGWIAAGCERAPCGINSWRKKKDGL